MKRIVLLTVCICLAVLIIAPSTSFAKIEKKKRSKGKDEPGLSNLKKVVAVADFKGEDVAIGSDIAVNLGDILVDKLVNTGKFIVVERDRNVIDLTLARAAEREQGAKQAGMSRGKGAEAGKAMAAQALFVGMIVGAGKGSSFGGAGGGWGGGGAGGGALGYGSNKVSILVRWYDTTTLQIKGSKECSATQGSVSLFGIGLASGAAGVGGLNLRDQLSRTFSRAMDKCVDWIVGTMERVPWEGRVISNKNGKVYINAGADAGVAVGQTFSVYKTGEELVDPDSGAILGEEEELSGQVQISQAQPKFSIGVPLSGSGFALNDIVREK